MPLTVEVALAGAGGDGGGATELQGACGDGRVTGVGVRTAEREDAAAGLDEISRTAADDAGDQRVSSPGDGEEIAAVGDRAAEGEGAGSAGEGSGRAERGVDPPSVGAGAGKITVQGQDVAGNIEASRIEGDGSDAGQDST